MSSNTIFHTLNSNNLPVDLIEVYDSSNATTNTIVTKFVTSSGQDLGSIFTIHSNLSSINKMGEQGEPCKYYLSNGTDIGTIFVKKNSVIAAGSVLFSATTFPQLAIWYDANDTTSLTKDTNNKVSSFNDKSGNNRNIIQPTTAYQPTFSSTAVNGKPGVSFTNVRGSILNTLYGDDTIYNFRLYNANFVQSIAMFVVSSGQGSRFSRTGNYLTNPILFYNNNINSFYGLMINGQNSQLRISGLDSSFRLESYISSRNNGTCSIKKMEYFLVRLYILQII